MSAAQVSAEESSTQIEVAFTQALIADGKEYLLDESPLRQKRGPPIYVSAGRR